MEQIATIVLPVFGIIGIGYLVAWLGVISVETGDAIADFVYAVPIPVLLFRTIATADIPEGAAPLFLLLAHFIGFSAMWTAGTLGFTGWAISEMPEAQKRGSSSAPGIWLRNSGENSP